MLHQPTRFKEAIDLIDTETFGSDFSSLETPAYYDELLSAMQLGLKDYLEKNKISDLVIGVSGGIDSAIDLYLAAQAVSPEHIHAIYMPTAFNSPLSLELSQKLAENLGISLQIGTIQPLLEEYETFADKVLNRPLEGVSHENIQARIRGNILMNIANDHRALVLNNSNKTELAL